MDVPNAAKVPNGLKNARFQSMWSKHVNLKRCAVEYRRDQSDRRDRPTQIGPCHCERSEAGVVRLNRETNKYKFFARNNRGFFMADELPSASVIFHSTALKVW